MQALCFKGGKMQVSLPKLATLVITTATITSGVVIYIMSQQVNLLKSQVSVYKSVQDIGLEKLSNNAQEATSGLQKVLADLTERNELIEKTSKQELIIAELKTTNESQENKISLLDSQLNSMFSSHNSFSLKNDQHIKLFKARYVLAIRKVQEDNVYYSINNEIGFMKAGEYVELNKNGVPCKLFLESFQRWKIANFSVLCEKT